MQSVGEEHFGLRATARDGQRHRQAALGQVKGLPSLLEAQGDPGQIQGESPFASKSGFIFTFFDTQLDGT